MVQQRRLGAVCRHVAGCGDGCADGAVFANRAGNGSGFATRPTQPDACDSRAPAASS